MTARMPTLNVLRRTRRTDDPEGLIRLLFLRDRGRIGLVQTAQETAENADQFLVRYLAAMIDDVAAPAVVVTVCRADGRPNHIDRQLFTLLSQRLASTSTVLLDLISLGPDRAWSVRRGRALSPPRRRRASRASQQGAAQKSASPATAR